MCFIEAYSSKYWSENHEICGVSKGVHEYFSREKKFLKRPITGALQVSKREYVKPHRQFNCVCKQIKYF